MVLITSIGGNELYRPRRNILRSESMAVHACQIMFGNASLGRVLGAVNHYIHLYYAVTSVPT